jgi:hypothetical protein
MAAKYNIIVDQGSDYDLSVNLTNDGVAIDLTGYAIRGQIRPTITSATLSASFTGTTVLASSGQFLISLTAATTTAMSPGLYYYDVEIYKSPYVTRLLEGTLTVRPEVTR